MEARWSERPTDEAAWRADIDASDIKGYSYVPENHPIHYVVRANALKLCVYSVEVNEGRLKLHDALIDKAVAALADLSAEGWPRFYAWTRDAAEQEACDARLARAREHRARIIVQSLFFFSLVKNTATSCTRVVVRTRAIALATAPGAEYTIKIADMSDYALVLPEFDAPGDGHAEVQKRPCEPDMAVQALAAEQALAVKSYGAPIE